MYKSLHQLIGLSEIIVASEHSNAADSTKEGQIHTSDLLASLSYMLDITPKGNYFHAWRVALTARRVADLLAPNIQRDVFLAGLLADVGAVGADMHISQYPLIGDQLKDHHIASHPLRSAALLDWFHGLEIPARLVRSHHEWWDGNGYPARQIGDQIPIGSQILRVVDAADLTGCFKNGVNVRGQLATLAGYTDHVWSPSIWDAILSVVADADFCMTITDNVGLPYMMAAEMADLGLPEKLSSQKGVEQLFHLMATLVDFKDPSTRGHSIRTARYAKGIALEMDMPEKKAHYNYRAGLVHDVGRMGISTYVLGKQGPLREEEMALVRKHAEMTISILTCLPDRPGMAEFARVAGHDHERFDGSGYPHRLAGKNIPIMSRIISAADAFDVVTHPPSYRSALSERAALARLKVDARTQFDPDVIDALESLINSGVIEDIMQAA